MKKFAFVTTLLVSAVMAASVASSAAVFADDTDDTFYPVAVSKTLSFTDLSAYAIEGKNSIFADGDTVIMLQDDTIMRSAEESAIEAVDVQDGVFFKQLDVDSETVSYAYTDGAWVEETEHDYTPRNYSYLDDGYTFVVRSDSRYTYHTSSDGLTIVDLTSGIQQGTTLEDYTLLTYYDNVVYAVKDNVLYTFDGETPSEKVFTYFQDEDETSTILVGTSLDKIAATAWASLQKVTVSASTAETPVYMTEISLDKFNEDADIEKTYFIPGDTFEVTSTSKIKAGTDLLLLCAVGNAYIVSYDTQAYIMAQTGGTVADIEVTEMEADSTAVEEFGVYYVPFISTGSYVFTIKVPEGESSNTYTIAGAIYQQDYPFLAHDFYVIEDLKADEADETVYGFVPMGCITLYPFPAENPSEVTDPNADYSNYIERVVLYLLLVVIILGIIGYIVFVATGRKYRNGTAPDPAAKKDGNDDGSANDKE